LQNFILVFLCSYSQLQSLDLTPIKPLPGGDKLQMASFNTSREVVALFVNGFIDLPLMRQDADELLNGCTLELWLRVHEEYSAASSLVRLYRKGSNERHHRVLELSWEPVGGSSKTGFVSLNFYVNEVNEVLFKQSVEAGTWQHFAITSNGEGTVCFYLCSKLVGTKAISDDTSTLFFDYISIGKLDTEANFTVRMREYRLWKGVRSPDELNKHLLVEVRSLCASDCHFLIDKFLVSAAGCYWPSRAVLSLQRSRP